MRFWHALCDNAEVKLNQLEAFVHVVEHGSFSKAALVLGMAQPALSRQVRALEVELRDTLLLRHGRGVKPTEAGLRLLAHGRDILHQVALAKADLLAQKNEPIGQIVVAMPPTLARQHTLPLIQTFRSELPKARLTIVEGFSVHLTEWLLTGRVDLALIYNPQPWPELDITPLRTERLKLISTPSQAPRRPLTLQRLSALPLVMPQRGQIFRSLMESAAAMAGVRLRVEWEVSSVPAILDLVAAGIGHATLGEEAVQAAKHPATFAITAFADTDIASTLCLVRSAGKPPSPLIERTADLLKDRIGSSTAEPLPQPDTRSRAKRSRT